MAFEKAQAHLARLGLADRIREFTVSSATVALAAQALGCEEAHIAKSLTFRAGERIVMIVTAGDMKIDNPKYKAFFGTKATMLPFAEVEALIGHGVGGVCPFGINEGVSVYLDESLKRFEVVYPACGSENSAVRLTIPELETAAAPCTWVDLCKPMS